MSRGRRRILRAILAAPLSIRILVGAVLILALWSAVNWGYQVIRKPTELFFPVSGALAKTPPETWRRYGRLFREHSTAVITPDLLAALAQVEGRGNPVARTYWRWRLTWNPFQLYQPASSGSACTRSPMRRFGRRSGTASTTTWWSRMAPGTTCGRAGSPASTLASCRATPSS